MDDGALNQENVGATEQLVQQPDQSKNVSEMSADILSTIPEEMRSAIAMLIQQSVAKQVEEKVAAEVEKMQAEVKDLKEQVVELEKQKSNATKTTPTQRVGTATSKRYGIQQGISRLNAKNAGKNSSGGAGNDVSPRGTGPKSARGGPNAGPTTGLKRPTTAASKVNGGTTTRPTTGGGLRGLKNSNMAPTVKSAEKDEVDPVYKERDPIDVMMNKRLASGQKTAVVPDKNSKQGKFFFTLKLSGEKLVITEQQKYNNQKELGLLDRFGNQKVTLDACIIEKQLDMRLKEKGESITNVVKKNNLGDEEGVFTLKLKGGQPKLQQPAMVEKEA